MQDLLECSPFLDDVLRLLNDIPAAFFDLYVFGIWLSVVFILLAGIVCIYIFALLCFLHFVNQAVAEVYNAARRWAWFLYDVAVGFPAYAVHILWTYIFCEGGWRLAWTVSEFLGIRVWVTYVVRPRAWVCAKPLPVKEVAEKEQQAGTNTKKSSRPVVFNMGKISAGGTSVGLQGVSLRAADVVKNGVGRDVPNEEVATKIAQALAQNKESDPVHSSLNLAGRISQLGELRVKSAGQMKKMPKRSGAAH
eukprot:g16157.t1